MKFNFKLFPLLLSFLFIINTNSTAQNSSVYMPVSIQNVYNGNTRSWDGKPGNGYWINSAKYNLKANVNIDSSIIYGKGQVEYFNNSPDTLKMLVIQLLQNRFKKGSQKDYKMNPAAFTNGMVITKLAVGDSVIDLTNSKYYFSSTNLFLRLPNPLAPKDSVKLSYRYHFKIQAISPGRMGKYADGVYDIAYWYPKVAVYDDVHGWDTEEYAGSLEFYSDFSDYNFEITVPANYTIWAGGDLQNPDEVLPEKIASRYRKASASNNVVRIVTAQDYKNGLFSDSLNTKTWKFIAKNVADVSFAMSDHYLWDGVSIVVDDSSGRRTFAQAAYPDSTVNWERGAEITAASVSYLSHQMPGVPYPYSHMTSFCNGKPRGGMENPMMANDGAPKSFAKFTGLLFHEIAHTYFPFYMGTNERNYAWMDEGWATYFPTDFVPHYDSTYSHYRPNFKRAKKLFASEVNVPLMVTTKYLRGAALYFNAYRHAFAAYSSLSDLLGKKLFKKVMQAYIHRWNGKHPIPYDFFFTINDVAGKDYTWFLNKWFFDFAYCDLSLEKSDDNLIIKNLGGLPVKVDLQIDYSDGTSEIIHKSPAVWENGNKTISIKMNDKKISKAKILFDEIPDINHSNNVLTF